MPQSGFLDRWQWIDSLEGLFAGNKKKKKDTKECALTNRWNQCHWNREWILQAESLCRETAWGLFLGYTLCLSCGGFSRWDGRKRYTSPSEWMFKMLAGKICCICMSNVLSQVDALFIFFLNFSRFGCSFCTLKDAACHLCRVLRKSSILWYPLSGFSYMALLILRVPLAIWTWPWWLSTAIGEGVLSTAIIWSLLLEHLQSEGFSIPALH